ncbi:MAG TPA: MJ0042-type zinc finger domain-containing protein, partial [Orrella sp.]
MSLVTQCPKCASEYEVTADQLKLHDGLVRCGQCSNVFDGLACLKDSLPTLTRKAADTQKVVAPDDIAATDNLSSSQLSSDSHLAPLLDVRADSDSPEDTPVAAPPASPAPTEPSPPSWQEPLVKPISPVPTPAPTPAPAPTFTTSLADDKPAKPVDDGPFIPSVDRIAHNRPQVPGRQEPSLVSRSAWSGAPKTGAEPGFSKTAGAASVSSATAPTSAREPILGSLLANDGEQPGVGSQAEPTVKVMGESRLRGDDPSAAG